MIDPNMDPRRRCFKVCEWPEQDRCAWNAAIRRGDILDDIHGAAAHWAPATVRKNSGGYGRWLAFLMVGGRLDALAGPVERVTSAAVRDYLAQLRAIGNSPYTVRNRIGELLTVVRAFAPNRDWSWLRALHGRLSAEAHPVSDKLQRIVSAAEISQLAYATMDEADRHPSWPANQKAVRYRDGLMAALLILCPGMRLRNLTAIAIDNQLRCGPNGYRLIFEAHEMKARRPHEEVVPAELTQALERYIGHYRPLLLGATASDRLWLSLAGQPMSERSVYHQLVKITTRAFGEPINPHLFRDCAATTIAIEDPEHVRIAAAVLGHASFKTTEKHYIQAHSLAASRRLGATIRALRREIRS